MQEFVSKKGIEHCKNMISKGMLLNKNCVDVRNRDIQNNVYRKVVRENKSNSSETHVVVWSNALGHCNGPSILSNPILRINVLWYEITEKGGPFYLFSKYVVSDITDSR